MKKTSRKLNIIFFISNHLVEKNCIDNEDKKGTK